MTYYSLLWFFEGEVITEVADFKQEEKEKSVFWKLICPCREFNPGHLSERQECWPVH